MPGEVGQGVAVGVVGLPEPAPAGWSGAGELGEAGYQEPLGQPGEEQGDGQAVGGDLVGTAVRDAFDDLVGAEPAQVVADLAAGHGLWCFPELGGEVVPQVAAGEASWPEREGAAGAQEGLDAGVRESHSRDAGAGGADDRAGEGFERGGSVGGVVADAFGVQQAPVGGVADLGHGGEVSQLFADAEVARLVQRGLGAERSPFLQVILSFRVSWGCDLRRPVVDSVAGGTLTA